MLLELFLDFMWLVFYNVMMIIKYLKDEITFTCIYCHYYVVPGYSAYMIMYKRGGGGRHTQIAWLAGVILKLHG